jgi:hypothetical protein
MNKALEQVLKNASPKELEVLSQGKDLKSVMDTILKQSSSDIASNKELLQLVKENPTLKNLGEVTTTIKDLLNSIKSEKNPLPMEKVLKDFLIDIKDLKNDELKQKLNNSGVFLESKLKGVKNPQVELKNALTSLIKNLESSRLIASKAIVNSAKNILNSEVVKSASTTALVNNTKENPENLKQLASSVKDLTNKLSSQIKRADSLNSPALLKAVEKLEHQMQTKLLAPENFKLSSLKETLQTIYNLANKSVSNDSKSIIGALEKLFNEKIVPDDINKLTANLKNILQKADPIFSKETALIFNKLENLSTPKELNIQNSVKEIISKDLKAILLQAGDEIKNSSNPNQNEILKNIDKLTLQIDHYQLISHLGNSSAMYLPFSWDSLEEGNIEMKKSKDDKFLVDIDLKLKEYGELNLKLTLYEKNQLNLHIYSSNEKLKEMVKENIPMLRSALIETQITPREIRIFDPKKKIPASPYQSQVDDLNIGFEAKV